MDSTLYLAQMHKSAVTLEDLELQMMTNYDPEREQPSKQQELPRHHHQYSELFACISGEVWLDTADGLLQLAAGDLAVVPPGIPHVHIPRLQEEDWCVISFTGIRRTAVNTRPLYRRCAGLFSGKSIRVLRRQAQLCQTALNIAAETPTAPECLAALRLAELLLRICELQPDARPLPPRDTEESELSRSAYLEYLVENYFMRPVTAQQIAAMMYISPRQLARIIQKRYGTTLHELLMANRIVTAEHLLRTTALTIDEITRAVGFSSRAGLYREFVRRHGITPAQYRQNQTR